MKIKASLLVLLLAAFGVTYYIYQGIHEIYEINNTQVQIPRGYGFSKINGLLSAKGVVKDSRLFYHYAKWRKSLHSLQAGHYSFPAKVSMKQVLNLLNEGAQNFTKVTIPEGKNLYEIAHILEKEKIIYSAISFIKLAKSVPDQSLGLPSQATSLEGYLYPETYYFSPQSSPTEVIYTMVLTFNQQTRRLLKNNRGLNWHQLVTLASVVEKETGAAFERPQIAGVFFNRLKKKMKLQSDPTTIYGIFERFDGNLRKKDLLEKTAYNTYRIKGLPPGPIASPGLAALKAVLEPADHSFLYFVSKNNGTHIFSENYKKHREAVNYYQKKRR